MSKKPFFKNLYQDPFQSPRAKRKHASAQVNSETQKSQGEIILERRATTLYKR
ncbi:YpzG family protein [Radiobacillus kanasensis]|uniref:YpzG family protein n=1 Tax=Radiobacillus kanasensis TaxID=2844358 RepID=UPI001E4CED4A|nr:YpzG family protein [Radiobacillus kanasensis]UFU00065.1 YpzG family protein [Radiobacillus kanasensis]